jgi:aminoglycoside phosphotransferase (APT) family kinase protein
MAHTHAVEITGSTLTKRYVSWSRDEPAREWSALRLISWHAPDLVPAPLASVPQPPSISMTVIPGRPLGGALDQAELRALERALRDLWSIPPDGLAPIEVAAFVARVRDALAVLPGSGVIAEAAAAAREWLPEFAEVGAPIVGHGDPNLANYLYDGHRVRIVDFEDAGRSDLAFELANLVEHLASRATDWTGFVERFAVDPSRFHAARCLYAAFWLTLVAPGGPSVSRNPPGTAELQAQRVMGLIRRTAGGVPGG